MSSSLSILGTQYVPRGMAGWTNTLLENKSDLVCTEEKTKAQECTGTEQVLSEPLLSESSVEGWAQKLWARLVRRRKCRRQLFS